MTSAPDSTKQWLLTVDSSVIEGVGRVTIHFTHLEEEVTHFVWSLIAGRDVLDAGDAVDNNFVAQKLGQAVTLNLGFRQKVEILGTLFFERFSDRADLMKILDVLKDALHGVAERRNRLTHSTLVGTQSSSGGSVPGATIAIKASRDNDKGMTHSITMHTQEELGQLADLIARLGFQLHELRQQCFKAGGSDEQATA